MPHPRFVSFAIAALLTLAAAAFWPASMRNATVVINAPDGMLLTVTCVVDGKTSEFERTGPAQFEISAREMLCTVVKDSLPGEVVVRILMGETVRASAGTGSGSVVRCGFRTARGVFGSGHVFADRGAANYD